MCSGVRRARGIFFIFHCTCLLLFNCSGRFIQLLVVAPAAASVAPICRTLLFLLPPLSVCEREDRMHKEKKAWTFFSLHLLSILFSCAKTKYSDQNSTDRAPPPTHTSKFTLEFVFIMKNESSKVLFLLFWSNFSLFLCLRCIVVNGVWKQAQRREVTNISSSTGAGGALHSLLYFSIVALSGILSWEKSSKKIIFESRFYSLSLLTLAATAATVKQFFYGILFSILSF